MYKISIQKTTKPEKPAKAAKPPKPVKVRKPLSRKKKALIILAVFLVLLGGGVYAANKTLTGPAVGTIVTTMPAVTRKPQVELKQFDGTNFSLALPVTFTEQAVKPGANSGTNNLETHTFISNEMITQVLVTTVTKLNGAVEEDPSYMVRAQEPAKYKMKPIVVKNEKVIIFTANDTQQMQQTVFWAHGGKLLTMTLSGVATDIQITTAQFDDMIASIVWR